MVLLHCTHQIIAAYVSHNALYIVKLAFTCIRLRHALQYTLRCIIYTAAYNAFHHTCCFSFTTVCVTLYYNSYQFAYKNIHHITWYILQYESLWITHTAVCIIAPHELESQMQQIFITLRIKQTTSYILWSKHCITLFIKHFQLQHSIYIEHNKTGQHVHTFMRSPCWYKLQNKSTICVEIEGVGYTDGSIQMADGINGNDIEETLINQLEKSNNAW